MAFFHLESLGVRKRAPGVEMRVVSGERMTMVFFSLEPGGGIPEHAHPHEQMGTVLGGEIELLIGEERRVVREGDAYHIPSGVLHSARASDSPARVLDVFSPPREDYR